MPDLSVAPLLDSLVVQDRSWSRSGSIFTFWLLAAIALSAVNFALVLRRPFEWASADTSIMARSFSRQGVWALRGIPVNNNAPLGLKPDTYIHWPALFEMLLGLAFRTLGESEAIARELVLLILAATCLALYELAAVCWGSRTGWAAVFAWLTLPTTALYGPVVIRLHLAIFGLVFAVVCFVKATQESRPHRVWAAFGIAAIAAAVATSWEPVLACPALLAGALFTRDRLRVRLAAAYSAAAIIAAVTVLANYLLHTPGMAGNLLQTLLYRMHLAPNNSLHFDRVYSHIFADFPQPPVPALLRHFGAQLVFEIGPAGIVALGWSAIYLWSRRRQEKERLVLVVWGALATPWLVWFVLMSNHAFIHSYQMSLGGPVTSLAIAIAAVTALNWVQEHSAWLTRARLVAMALAPGLLLLPLARELRHQLRRARAADPLVAYGLQIKRTTEPGSVVITPLASMVPVYYSERRLIRVVPNDAELEQVIADLPTLFPGSRLYLALRPRDSAQFSRSLARFGPAAQSTELALLALPAVQQSAAPAPPKWLAGVQ